MVINSILYYFEALQLSGGRLVVSRSAIGLAFLGMPSVETTLFATYGEQCSLALLKRLDELYIVRE